MAVFAAVPAFPQDPLPQYPMPMLALAPLSTAIDTGVPIANINDGHAGAAPDLGAVEAGAKARFASGFEG